MSLHKILALILPAAIAGAALAQPKPFDAIPDDQESLYHYNWAKVFYASPEDADKAVARCEQIVVGLETLKGHVIDSPGNLLKAFQQSDEFTVLFNKLYAYMDLHYSVNTNEVAWRDRALKLSTTLPPRLAFISTELQQITPQRFAEFTSAEPRLRIYSNTVTEALRNKPHTLSLPEEELLGRTSPLMTQWQADEYELLMDRAKWGKVKDPELGELDVRQDQVRIANSKTRDVRRDGQDKSAAGYREMRDLSAFLVRNVAKSQNEIAMIRHFRNGQEAAFFADHLTYAQAETVFNSIIGHGDLNRRMQTMRRARTQSFTGYEVVHNYDMTVVPPGVIKPTFTIDQAREVILRSTKWLGADYNSEMGALLDPHNGRLDIVPGPHRVPNAFATYEPGSDEVFYSYAFQGYVQDVSTLAHEGGHVVMDGLQNLKHVPAALSDGPHYFTEGFAMFNEYVLLDSLYKQASEPALKVYFLEQLLQRMLSFYRNTGIAVIEKEIYENSEKGVLLTPDDLDALTYKYAAKTSIWLDIDPDLKNQWQVIPHYYSSPAYYVNYVFADLVAQTCFARYRQDAAGFAPNYTALQANGFTAPPDELMKRFLSIDLTDPSTLEGVFRQQEKYLEELEALYKQVPVKKP
jgi:oligoendopeptidase F